MFHKAALSLTSKGLSIFQPCIRDFSSKLAPVTKQHNFCFAFKNSSLPVRKFSSDEHKTPGIAIAFHKCAGSQPSIFFQTQKIFAFLFGQYLIMILTCYV